MSIKLKLIQMKTLQRSCEDGVERVPQFFRVDLAPSLVRVEQRQLLVHPGHDVAGQVVDEAAHRRGAEIGGHDETLSVHDESTKLPSNDGTKVAIYQEPSGNAGQSQTHRPTVYKFESE